VLGSTMIGAGLALDAIFYVLAGLGLLGMLLTLLVPMARGQIETRRARSSTAAATARPAVAAPAAALR
jgi:AAHS family benzoate transporter-like MFS transporter